MNFKSYKQELAELKKQVLEFDTISFDIFDTLVFREVVHPQDVFDLFSYKVTFDLQESFNTKLKGPCPSSFRELRVASESEARKRHADKEDITLEDIYRVISNKIGSQKARLMKEAELALEDEFIVANPLMKEIYEFALKHKKQILIITDMYLPKTFLEEKLKRLGFENYKALYVSGELNKSKAFSSIFPYVQKAHQIDPSKWLHIGDNQVSDVENPEKLGISAYYYPMISKRYHAEASISVEDSILTAIKIHKLYAEPERERSYWEKFGIEYLSPLYFGFTNWLVQLSKRKDNLYFLARDGYIPHKIYQKFRSLDPGLPEGKYLYASRRAYQYAHIYKMHKNHAISLLTEFNWGAGQRLFIKDIFDNLNLDPSYYKDIFPIFGLESEEDEVLVDENLHQVRKFLSYIYPDIIKKIKTEFDLLMAYFEEEGVNQFDQVNIVDVGWRGSTQFAMKEILDDKDIIGYYFGTISTMNPEIYSDSFGFYFDLDIPVANKDTTFSNIMMYELIFSAPHGSLIHFEKKGKQVVPVLKEVEANELNYKIVNEFQEAALSVMDAYLTKYEYLKNISPEVSVKNYRDFVLRYGSDDLRQFKDLSNNLGIGLNKDVRPYVNVINYDEWIQDKSKIHDYSALSLWKRSVLVKKGDDYISMHEGEVLEYLQSEVKQGEVMPLTQEIAAGLDHRKKEKNVLVLLIKSILNPRKTIKKLKELNQTKEPLTAYIRSKIRSV